MQRRNRTSAPGRLLRDLDIKDIEEILSTLERGSPPLANQTIIDNNAIPPRTNAVPIQRPQVIRNSVSAPGSVQMSASKTPPLDSNITQNTTPTTIDNQFVFVQYDPDIRSSTAPRGEKSLMQRGDTFAKKKTVFDQLKNRFDLR